MISQSQIDQQRRALHATFPLIGPWRRRSAAEWLYENRNDPAVVPLILEGLKHADAAVAARAERATLALVSAPAIDQLCAAWDKQRDKQLGQFIVEKKYVAGKPSALRARTALKSGQHQILVQEGSVLIADVLAARDDVDKVISANALKVLSDLQDQEAIDQLCAEWVKARDKQLGELIVAKAYIASKPVRVRLLSAIKAGKAVQVNRADMVPVLIENLSDSDDAVRKGVIQALESIQDGPALDALCDEAIMRPSGPVAKFCKAKDKFPRNHERLCLFLFVTRQLDQYFKEDFEFQNLRLEFERADAAVQQHVMEVLRSGDRRCVGWFASGKPLYECDEHEIELALNSYESHAQWDKFFEACLNLPLKVTWTRFPKLKNAGWKPVDAALRSVLEAVIRETDGAEAPAPLKPPATSSVFENWLARGQSTAFSSLSSAQILERLGAATPPDGVALVAALASKEKPGAASADRIRNHPHWLVRLAGYATGLCPVVTDEKVSDSNYWIGELAMAADVLSVVPGRATPADLKRLQQLPQEALVGRLGASRRVLRTILNYSNTIGTFGKDVAAADPTAGAFSRASDDDFDV